jgi:chaperonin GroES
MIKPIGDWVLLKSQPSDEMSEGGIIVPDSVKKDSNRMTIIAVGEGSENNPMQFKPMTTAFRVKDWGVKVEYESESYYMMRQQDILATL